MVLNPDYGNSKSHFYTFIELLCGMTSAADVTNENKTWESFLEVFETNQGWGHLKNGSCIRIEFAFTFANFHEIENARKP